MLLEVQTKDFTLDIATISYYFISMVLNSNIADGTPSSHDKAGPIFLQFLLYTLTTVLYGTLLQ